MRSAALRPEPVSTATAVARGAIVPSSNSRVSAAPAVAAVGSKNARAGLERTMPARSRPRRRPRRRPVSGVTRATPAPVAPAASCDAVGERRSRNERHEAIGICRPRRRKASHRRLHREKRGRIAISRSFQRVDAAFEAEDVAAVAGRHQNVVRQAVTELLPQLEGHGLRTRDEVRMPVVTGVKAFIRGGERGFGDGLPGAGNRTEFRAGGGDPHQLGARCRGRNIDRHGMPPAAA